VIKYDTTQEYSSVQLWGNVVCATAPYRPAIFTSCNDESVGPIHLYSRRTHKLFQRGFPLTPADKTCHARFAHFLHLLGPASVWREVHAHKRTICPLCRCVPTRIRTNLINNILMQRRRHCFWWRIYHLIGLPHDNCRCDELDLHLGCSVLSSVKLTNSLLVNVADNGNILWQPITPKGPRTRLLQTVGAGSYYLATPNYQTGTTNIDPSVLADIRARHASADCLCRHPTISVDTTLQSAKPPRDTNATPALGYHYDPIDYAVGNVTISDVALR